MPMTSRARQLANDLRRRKTAARRTTLIDTYGRRTFENARSAGFIVAVLPQVYVSHLHVDLMAARLAAASCWVDGRGAISGLASCMIHGLKVPDLTSITVVSTATRVLSPPDWLCLRRLGEDVPRLIHSGYSVTALPHALVHAWWDTSPEACRGLIIDASRQRPRIVNQIRRVIDEHQRLPRRRELIRFLDSLNDGIESYLEYLADTTVFDIPALRHLKKQERIRVGGRTFRADAFDSETKTVIELDGAAYHSSDAARRRDIERDAILIAHGYIPLHFTFEQVAKTPQWCQTVILKTIASRRAT